jgi:hypothetical protein
MYFLLYFKAEQGQLWEIVLAKAKLEQVSIIFPILQFLHIGK